MQMPKRTERFRLAGRSGRNPFPSLKEGRSNTIPVKGLIPGMKEAITRMTVGSKWHLYIPSELAYGVQGAGPVGPNATVIFKIELLSIKDKLDEPFRMRDHL
jgi:FKBP-type peptidyl-prolyl cis-trans isomerase